MLALFYLFILVTATNSHHGLGRDMADPVLVLELSLWWRTVNTQKHMQHTNKVTSQFCDSLSIT